MRSIYLAAGAAGLLGLFVACGGDDKPAALPDGTGNASSGGKKPGGRSSAGEGGESEGGAGGTGSGGTGSGVDEPHDPLAPIIVITSPEGVDDPNEDGVISGNSVSVTCKVTDSPKAGSSRVNEASVKIVLADANGKLIEEKAGVPTEQPNEFASEFGLTNVAAGAVAFVCRAEDLDMHAGSDKVKSFLDHGPTIEFIKPVAMSAHALTSPLDVEFTVAASPLSADDEHAEVDEVTLDIAGVNIGLASSMAKPGHYRLQINLQDPKFNPTPNGDVPVTVRATNQRTPAPVAATLTQPTAIDGSGPTIKIVSPLNKDVVGGTVRLKFDATDAISGVDPRTVVVSLNNVDHPYDATSDRWTLSGNTFTYEFDSRQVKDARVQITVNIGASDQVGNPSAVSSELLYLDNYPPIVDLDPANIRTITRSQSKCSGSFDPVGIAAENDLGSAAVASTFRAVVWDTTNTDPEIPIAHFSNTNPASVRLYLEGDNAKPLLIDKDKDGACDEVAKVDSTNSIELHTVTKSDTPWYVNDPGATPIPVPPCIPEDAPKPKDLCDAEASDMWQVIEDDYNHTPVIYAVGVTNGLECTGVAWEFTTKLNKDGWACFAARAVDNVGNVGISRPLRVCVDDPDVAGSPACASSSTTPPTCTDGCTIPARWGNAIVPIP